MKQTVETRTSKVYSQTTGKSSVENKVDNMTSYLEDNSMVATAPKAAELTPHEKEAALKAIKYYKSLSYVEIDKLLEQSSVVIERNKKRRKNTIKHIILVASILAVLAISIIYLI